MVSLQEFLAGGKPTPVQPEVPSAQASARTPPVLGAPPMPAFKPTASIESTLTPQEKQIVDYHRQTIESGQVGKDPEGRPVTVYALGIRIPEGKHAGQFVSVPGYIPDKGILTEEEAFNHWRGEIEAGKWPFYRSGEQLNQRAREIHQIMDQEEGEARAAQGPAPGSLLEFLSQGQQPAEPAKPAWEQQLPQAVQATQRTPLQEALGVTQEQAVGAALQRQMKQQLVEQARAQLGPRAAEMGPWERGLAMGSLGLREFTQGLKALGATVFGDDEAVQEAADAVMRLQAQREVFAPKYQRVEDLLAKGGIADFYEWAASGLAEQVPNIASIVATGGLGGLVGRKVAQLQAAKIVDDITARKLVQKFTEKGVKAGAFLGSAGIETGATSSEQLEAIGRVEPVVAVGAGLLKAGLEIAAPMAVAQRFGLGESLAGKFTTGLVDRLTRGGLVRRTAGGALALSAGEGVTEGLQETIDTFARSFVDKNYEALGPEGRSRILNAVALGSLLGGTIGGAVGALAPQGPRPGAPLSPEEAGAILRGPDGQPMPQPELQMPGGFTTQAELEAEGPTEFRQRLDAELQGPGPKLQVDLAQVPVDLVTARLDTLPDSWDWTSAPGAVQGPPEAIVKAQEAQTLFRQGKLRELEAEQGTKAGVQQQARGRSQQQAAREMYQEAVTEGFRYMPEGGLEQLQREGFVLAGPVPQGAIREVQETGQRILPEDVLTINYQAGDKNFKAADYRGQSNAWVLRSDLAPWQLSADQKQLQRDGFQVQQEKIHFSPDVAIDEQAALAQEFVELVERNPPGVEFAPKYANLLARGLRYEPDAGTSGIVLDLRLGQVRARPAQLQQRGSFWDDLQAASDTALEDKLRKGGVPYSGRDHKAGEVKAYSDSNLTPEIKRNFQRLVSAAKVLLPKLMPHVRLVITAKEALNTPYKQFIGSHAQGFLSGYAHIQMDPAQLVHSTEAATVFFHELGHILHYSALQHATVQERSAIFTAWLRHVQAQSQQTGSEFFLAFAHPLRFLWRGENWLVREATGNAAEAIAKQKSFQSWYGFHEWFAENTAKWLTSERSQPAGVVERFFKRIFDKMKQIVQVLRRKFPGFDMEPEAAIRDFLDRIYAEGGAKQPMPEPYLHPQQWSDETPPLAAASAGGAIGNGLQQLGVPGAKQFGQDVDKYAWYVRWGWNLVQLAQANRHILPLQQYVERTRAWHIEKMRWISMGQERVVAWRNMGKEMGQRFSEFIWEIESMSYLKPKENARQPTVQELQALVVKHKLNREALDFYLQIKGDFDQVLAKIESIWTQQAASSIQDPAQLAKAVKQIQGEMRRLRSRPYFPHSRFGDWAVAVRDAKGKLVEFRQFENEKAQRDAAEELRELYPGLDVQQTRIPAAVKVYRGMPPLLLQQMQEQLEAKGKLTKEQRIWLEHFQFEMSPANSFAKHMKKRKGTPGWHRDALRGYANYMFHAGHHLARMEYRPGLEQAISDVIASGRGMLDANKRVMIADYLTRHLDYILYPPNELTAVRSFGFTWLLGFAPDSAIINLSQIPLVAAPYLSARFSDGSAIRNLMQASRQWHSFYKMKQHMAADELQAYDLAIQQGFVDESFAAELAGHAHGGNLARMVGGTAAERAVAGLGRAAAFMFQTVEKLNRTIVFTAAYRMGRDSFSSQSSKTQQYLSELRASNQELFQSLLVQGWTEANATGFLAGRDAVERTQFEYAQWARPEFMRGKKGALFTFFMFLQNSLWFARYSPGNKRYLALLLATAGLMGLPLAEDLNAIIKALVTKLGGSYFNPELELRKILAELVEKPDLIMHGLGRESFGLQLLGDAVGIPVPGFDFSSRLGFGRIVPGLQPALELGSRWETRVARTFEEVIGASYSIPYGVVEATSSFEPDNFKSYERMMPRAFKNLARGARWLYEGEETTRTGVTLRRFDPEDPISMLEILGGSVGFSPTELRRQWDRIGAEREATAYWEMQRAVLYDQYWRAARVRDREAIADVRSAIRKFNQEAPDPALRITAQALSQSVRSRQTSRLKQEAGRPLQRSMTGVTREVQGAYPEAPALRQR